MCAALIAVTLLLYRKALRLWWTFDDAYLLHTAVERRIGQYFTDGSVWRAMPNRLFTPLLQTSYDAELSWFGLDPRRFFIIHLCELALVAVAIYVALRLWIPAVAAFCGAFLVLAGAPTASAATELMVMHYLQAIILTAFALSLHVLALRGHRRALNALSAFLYLTAMLAKEIAVPLPAFLLLLSDGGIRQRVRRTCPHWLALAVYVIWRRLMLGEFFGGYGWTITRAEVPALLLSLPAKLAAAMAGPNLLAGTLLLVAIAVSIALGHRGLRAFLMVIAGLVLAIVPIIPISKEMQPRFALASWIVLAAGAAIAASKRRPPTSFILLGTLVILGLAVQRTAWPVELRRAQRMSDEGRFYFEEMQPGSFLRSPTVPPAAMGEVQWLKEIYAKRPAGAGWFADDWYGCTHDLSAAIVWQYSEGLHQFERRSLAETSRACRGVRTEPLAAEFHHRGNALFWRLGPYREGHYRFLLAEGVQAFDVLPEDGFRFGDLAALTLRIRYQSPAGWVTYSDQLALDFVRHPDLSWKR